MIKRIQKWLVYKWSKKNIKIIWVVKKSVLFNSIALIPNLLLWFRSILSHRGEWSGGRTVLIPLNYRKFPRKLFPTLNENDITGSFIILIIPPFTKKKCIFFSSLKINRIFGCFFRPYERLVKSGERKQEVLIRVPDQD